MELPGASHPANIAIGTDHAKFMFAAQNSARNGVQPIEQHPMSVLGMNITQEGLAASIEFAGFASEQANHLFRVFGDIVPNVPTPGAHFARLQGQPQVLLAASQSLLYSPAFRHVARIHHDAGQQRIVDQVSSDRFQGEPFAVGVAKPKLHKAYAIGILN